MTDTFAGHDFEDWESPHDKKVKEFNEKITKYNKLRITARVDVSHENNLKAQAAREQILRDYSETLYRAELIEEFCERLVESGEYIRKLLSDDDKKSTFERFRWDGIVEEWKNYGGYVCEDYDDGYD